MNTTTRLFNIEKDLSVINSWCELREMCNLQEDQITPYGILAEVNNSPVSVIWMYPVLNSKICFIDNLISDPNCDKEVRNKALDSMLDKVHSLAKADQFKFMKMITNLNCVKARFEKHGYISDLNENYSNFIGVL